MCTRYFFFKINCHSSDLKKIGLSQCVLHYLIYSFLRIQHPAIALYPCPDTPLFDCNYSIYILNSPTSMARKCIRNAHFTECFPLLHLTAIIITISSTLLSKMQVKFCTTQKCITQKINKIYMKFIRYYKSHKIHNIARPIAFAAAICGFTRINKCFSVYEFKRWWLYSEWLITVST